jgi:hypothetical protein
MILHPFAYMILFGFLLGSNLQFCIGKLAQTLQEAIEMNNSVPQGLSSSIFTRRPEVMFKWIG